MSTDGRPSRRELLIRFWDVWSGEGAVGVLHRHDEFFTRRFQWRPPIVGMLGEAYVGREGWVRYASDFGDVFASFETENLEVSEVTPDLFTVKAQVKATRSGGDSSQALLFVVAGFRGGRISYGWGTYDPQEAETAVAAILAGEVAV